MVKGDDLVLATNGRSLWVFDDLTPLRADGTRRLLEKKAYLFPVQSVYRYRYESSLSGGLVQGTLPNPPAGAIGHFILKQKPKGDVTLEVLNAKGETIRKLTSKKEEEEKSEEGDYSEDDKEDGDTLPDGGRTASVRVGLAN